MVRGCAKTNQVDVTNLLRDVSTYTFPSDLRALVQMDGDRLVGWKGLPNKKHLMSYLSGSRNEMEQVAGLL